MPRFLGERMEGMNEAFAEDPCSDARIFVWILLAEWGRYCDVWLCLHRQNCLNTSITDGLTDHKAIFVSARVIWIMQLMISLL